MHRSTVSGSSDIKWQIFLILPCNITNYFYIKNEIIMLVEKARKIRVKINMQTLRYTLTFH